MGIVEINLCFDWIGDCFFEGCDFEFVVVLGFVYGYDFYKGMMIMVMYEGGRVLVFNIVYIFKINEI